MKATNGARGTLGAALREAADDIDGISPHKPFYVQERELPGQIARHTLASLEGLRHARKHNGEPGLETDMVLNRKGQNPHDQVSDLIDAYAADTGRKPDNSKIGRRIAVLMLHQHKTAQGAEQQAAALITSTGAVEKPATATKGHARHTAHDMVLA